MLEKNDNALSGVSSDIHIPGYFLEHYSAEELGSRAGFLYLIHAERTHRYKIGITLNPVKCLSALRRQSPYPLKIVKVAHVLECLLVEKEFHERLKNCRIHGEWFEFENPKLVVDCCFESIASLTAVDRRIINDVHNLIINLYDLSDSALLLSTIKKHYFRRAKFMTVFTEFVQPPVGWGKLSEYVYSFSKKPVLRYYEYWDSFFEGFPIGDFLRNMHTYLEMEPYQNLPNRRTDIFIGWLSCK